MRASQHKFVTQFSGQVRLLWKEEYQIIPSPNVMWQKLIFLFYFGVMSSHVTRCVCCQTASGDKNKRTPRCRETESAAERKNNHLSLTMPQEVVASAGRGSRGWFSRLEPSSAQTRLLCLRWDAGNVRNWRSRCCSWCPALQGRPAGCPENCTQGSLSAHRRFKSDS